MRRALLAWGLGHLALGDRRGWALLALEIASVALIGVLVVAFLAGTRAVLVFAALTLFFAIWGGQAIDAHRRAVDAGARPGGAVQLLALAPVVVVVMTAFWLVGGAAGSPAATLQRYVAAWQDRRPERATELFLAPPTSDVLGERWTRDEGYIRDRLRALAAGEPSVTGKAALDPDRPFRSLLVTLDTPSRAGTTARTQEVARAHVHIVRPVERQTTFLGIFPAASQEMVAAEPVGEITLRAVPLEPAVGLGVANEVWRIESVSIGQR